MKRRVLLHKALLCGLGFSPAWPREARSAAAGEWKRALVPEPMVFPRDHFSHPEYRTEWWYFTGNLRDGNGLPVGFQFTLFRQGVIPPGRPAPDSNWATRDVGFGHAALSFPERNRFVYGQVLERGVFGATAFPPPPGNTSPIQPGLPGGNESAQETVLARVNNWRAALLPDGSFRIHAAFDGHAIELVAKPMLEPVLQGEKGLSRKAAGEGNASHYYSIPRLETHGTITLDGKTTTAKGTAWLDREWASNQLGADQVGWDWFALRFEDGRDLMVYQMRRADGTRDPHSHGSLRLPDGTVHHLSAGDYQLSPGKTWRSPVTGGIYPIEWTLVLPAHRIDITILAAQENQELALQPVSYYEGAVRATGNPGGTTPAWIAEGYMELTGYASPLAGIRD